VKKIKQKLLIGALLQLFAVSAAYAQVDQQVMDASADQAQGNYTPMNLGYAGFNSLGMTQAAWLDPLQNLGEGQSKPAYSKYYWTPDLVLPVRVREGMITMLNFPEWELIEDIFIGDSATFDGQISGPSTLLLYPRHGANVGVDTNIIVFGRSGNRYVFYVKSEAVNTERLTNAIIDIDVVDDYAPSNAGSAYSGGASTSFANNGKNSKNVASSYTKRFQKNDWIQNIPVDPSDFKFDLEVYVPNPDDVVIAPERVWRDNIFTYIDLGKKAQNMTQRPVVSMIVERVEVPVGFRSKGPDNRLIIVEGVGDMVLRNGKRIICIKMRRSDDAGLEYGVDANDYLPPSWDVSPAIPNQQLMGYGTSNGGSAGGESLAGQTDLQFGQSQVIVPDYAQNGGAVQGNVADNFDYSKMQHISNRSNTTPINGQKGMPYGFGSSGVVEGDNSNISIELGSDGDVANLEEIWGKLSSKYSDVLGGYTPFFSVDAPADGQGKELFHLRVGPVKSLDAGDKICGELGRSGIFCSVVRVQ
jgi:type IV secretory pathway VirB9-like protein